MNRAVYNPTLNIVSSEKVDSRASEIIISLIKEKNNPFIIIPTGSTPLGMYANLVKECKKGTVDFSHTTLFNLDEYFPIDPKHSASYAFYMKKNLISHINIQKDNWHIPDGLEKTSLLAAEKYESTFNKQGQPDLAILGIGPGKTCHIGFNERGSSIYSRTRYVQLDPETAVVNKAYFPNPADIPKGAITLGIANILSAKRILLIAKGKNKAWGIQRSLQGSINSDAPASFLRYHPHVEFLLDPEAASIHEKCEL